MNKKMLSLSLVVISSLLLAGCTKPTATTQTTNQVASEASEFAGALQSGKPTTCTLTKDGNTMEYLIKNKLMRANMTTTVSSKTTVTHMINDQTFLYMWSDGQKQGTKVSAVIPSPSPMASAPTQPTTPKFSSEADYQGYKDQGYTINCRAGDVADSVFVPPTDITFIDPTEMMKQVTKPGTAGQIDYKKLQEQYGAVQQPGADGLDD